MAASIIKFRYKCVDRVEREVPGGATPEPVRRKLDHVVRLDVAGTATAGGASLWRVDKQNDELATTAGQRSKSNLAGLQLDGWLPGGCLVGAGSGDEAQALIELIRRLRASGITRDQVMMAFEQLDRLDMELGSALPCPVMPALMPRGPARNYMASREPPQLQNASSNDSATGDCGPHNGESVASPPTTTAASSGGGSGAKLPSELTIIPISANASPQGGNEEHGGYGSSGGGGGGASSNMYSSGVVPMQYLMNPHEFLQEESGDIDELKRSAYPLLPPKGEAAILSEIRNFVMRYNIKQTMIAEMTKLSQAYVSRFFRGDIADMSERTKNTFYMWYLTCKNNPWKLAQLCPNSGVKRMVSETGDLIPLKRERFTFKSAHLAVLERYYERDPYPDAQTREQIVEECNEAVERPERPLTEREKVSLPVVNNWFNNRRKEAKKQLRQQHAAAMAAAAQAGGLGGLPALTGGGHQKSPFSVGPPTVGRTQPVPAGGKLGRGPRGCTAIMCRWIAHFLATCE
ncbi:hypothetical protein MTO96_012311 [Rhipicephalus appendiculatus]